MSEQPTLHDVLDALTAERFTRTIPARRDPLTPTLAEVAERRRALIEASEIHIDTRKASA